MKVHKNEPTQAKQKVELVIINQRIPFLKDTLVNIKRIKGNKDLSVTKRYNP